MKRVVFGWLVMALCSLWFVEQAVAETYKTREVSIGDGCYLITAMQLLKNGNVKLLMKQHPKYRVKYCPENKIFDVDTYDPKGLIVGASGFNGKIPDAVFSVTVKPHTKWLKMRIKKEGIVKTWLKKINDDVYYLKTLVEAEESEPKWLKEFSEIQSTLAETKANDKTPPSIQILSPLPSAGQVARVDTYTSFVRGRVTDDAGVMNILVAGRRVGVKEDGTFASKVKLTIGRNDVLVQAEDINGNIAEQNITIVREEFIPEQILADVDLPPKTRMNNPDALGVVIGVESYQYVPDATYAYNDAEVFREYLAETMGVKRQRIQLATNTKATQAELSKLLGPNGWLARNVVKGKSDIIVYFSGHGIASPDGKSSGLLPFDVDPNYSIGLPLHQLYLDLALMDARSVTIFLDACFTGQTRNEELLIADSRPIVIKPTASIIPDNLTILTAATGAQISGAIKEKEHGLFTYYLLKGMGGDADTNKDNSVSVVELDQFVSGRVKEQAALSGREQTPEIHIKDNRILVKLN